MMKDGNKVVGYGKMRLPVQLKLNTEYIWKTKNKNPIVILADVMCLTMQDIKGIETFARNSNKVIATGLSRII
jgi:hypothetical protein